MIELNLRTLAAAALTSSVILAVTTTAWARDDRDWDSNRWERRHHHRYERVEHRHYYEPAPRVVYERQPVMVMPAPVYQAPAYSQPVDPSLNFNFSFPLR